VAEVVVSATQAASPTPLSASRLLSRVSVRSESQPRQLELCRSNSCRRGRPTLRRQSYREFDGTIRVAVETEALNVRRPVLLLRSMPPNGKASATRDGWRFRSPPPLAWPRQLLKAQRPLPLPSIHRCACRTASSKFALRSASRSWTSVSGVLLRKILTIQYQKRMAISRSKACSDYELGPLHEGKQEDAGKVRFLPGSGEILRPI
jgi:hypothetical protein